jgi:hypothetical protein
MAYANGIIEKSLMKKMIRKDVGRVKKNHHRW